MKQYLFVLSIFIIGLASCQNKSATDSESIVTDTVAIAVDSCITEPTSSWNVKYFIDEFGEKTNNAYLCHDSYGEFSNSATTNSRLTVRIIVTKKGVRFDTYEYGDLKMKGEGRLEYRAKLPNDSILYFHTWDDDEGFNTVNESDIEEVINLFKQYNEIKFAARTQNSYSVSTYRFSYVGNSNLFSKGYDELAE